MAIYKKNYLSSVIVRIDIEAVELAQFSNFLKSIEKDFPISEQKEGREGSLVLDTKTGETQQTHNKRMFWQIFDSERTRTIEVDTKYIYIEYKKYKDSTILIKDIENVFVNFIKIFKVQTIKRIGLRYINNFDFPKEKDNLNWGKYINKNLVSNLDFISENKLEVSRILGQMTFRKEDAYITFNYGIVNDDFPNQIVRKQFILDFDCVSKFPIETSSLDIIALIRSYNKYIENLFEASIMPPLRTILKK